MKRHLSRKMAGSDGFVGRTKISWETYLRRKLLGGEGILRVLLWEEHLRAPLFARVGRDTDCHHELCNQRWAEPLFLHGEALRTLTAQSSVYFSLRGIAYFCSHTLSIQSVWGCQFHSFKPLEAYLTRNWLSWTPLDKRGLCDKTFIGEKFILILKLTFWSRDNSVKCLPCKHNDPSSLPRSCIKK